MSHAGKVGFSGPFNSPGRSIVFSFALAAEPPHLQKAAPPVLFMAVGVGQRLCLAMCSSDGRTLPVLPAAPPWFVP